MQVQGSWYEHCTRVGTLQYLYIVHNLKSEIDEIPYTVQPTIGGGARTGARTKVRTEVRTGVSRMSLMSIKALSGLSHFSEYSFSIE
jgi:hypothetical protein